MNERRKAQVGGHGEKLSRKKESAIAALMMKSTIGEAARECGIAESTLRRWLAEPTFAEAYRKQRARLLETCGTLLRSRSISAIFVLGDIMESQTAKVAARVAAARGILDFCFRSSEVEELREIREAIARLETKLEGKR